MRMGFDPQKYIDLQSEHINQRRIELAQGVPQAPNIPAPDPQHPQGKLYLEMGGKLFDDLHASRVLPGFTPDNKIAMLQNIVDDVEIVVCLNAKDLTRQKVRADLGIPYEEDVLRLVDVFRERGFLVDNVVMTQLEDDNSQAALFISRLEKLGLNVVKHRVIPCYPSETARIISQEGFGLNESIPTTRDVIVATAPGPGSGKLATCLSQIYHDAQQGLRSGYAKFETFPIWNLPLEHPVNLAYEAATADLDDINIIDPFHLQAYGKQATSYNRDVEVFPLLKSTLETISGQSPYQSPTDMGVNMAGYCITDDDACRHAAKQEIIRRYYKALAEEHREELDPVVSERIALIMAKAGTSTADRAMVAPALEVEERTGAPGAAIQLQDGTIITGKTSALLGCSSAMLLNALKHLAGLDDDVLLLDAESIEPIQTLKTQHLGSRNPRLHTDEVLIALSVSASRSENARRALEQLSNLKGCDVHTTTLLGSVDEGIFRNLGVLVTSEPKFQRKALYQKR